jgi:lysophospholipase L1-like esterase
MPFPYARYVALGDSSTEGLDDPIGSESPRRYRGWADRLATHVAESQRATHPEAPPLHYANLAIRGRLTRQVLETQLAPALEMQPDLATVFAGTNDVIQSGFDVDTVLADLGTMQRALRDQGATVLTITMPDLADLIPLAGRVSTRLAAFNQGVRDLAAETGTLVAELAAHPWVTDPRFWSPDRLHANSEGHRRIALALAAQLGLPDISDEWAMPLPPRPAPSAIGRALQDLAWAGGHFLPWLWRHARGKSSGDQIRAKRPALEPVHVDDASTAR